MIIYSICLYYHTNKLKENINAHVNTFKKICEKEDKLVLNVMVDLKDEKDQEEKRKELKKGIDKKINYEILMDYNWGGTIVGLWNTYKYAERNYEEVYICHMEEDMRIKNEKILEDLKRILDENKDYIYVGETEYENKSMKGRGIIKNSKDYFNRNYKPFIKKMERLGDLRSCHCDGTGCENRDYPNCVRRGLIEGHFVWTDGGLYFTNLERLKMAEKSIGIFHKGDKDTKWEHNLDGVYYGEAGFPTLLYHKGLVFGSVYRDKYFETHYMSSLGIKK